VFASIYNQIWKLTFFRSDIMPALQILCVSVYSYSMSLVYLQISSYTIYRQVNQPIYYNSCLIYHSCWSPESSIKTLCTQKGAKNTFIDILIAYNVHNAYHHNSKSPHKCHIVTIDGLWINRDHVSLRHSCTSIAYCVNKTHHSHQPCFLYGQCAYFHVLASFRAHPL